MSKAEASAQKVLGTAGIFQKLGKLRPSQQKRITQALAILNNPSTRVRHQKYNLFLNQVLRESGRSAVLASIIALGQGRIADLNASERERLAQLIKNNKHSFSHQTIDILAANSGIPEAIDYNTPPQLDLNLNGAGGHQHHRIPQAVNYAEPATVHEIQSGCATDLPASLNASDSVQTEVQKIVDNATVEGTREVFGNYLCEAVRTRHVDGQEKSAVTIMLPKWGGLVDCLISLDIREQEVVKLALSLFNTDISRVESNLHVMLQTGLSVILSMPTAEVTLKGATDEAITKVFGFEICNAVTESPIRKREKEAGQQLTHCVSMILTKDGAIINISLGLEGGLAILKKLHPAPHSSSNEPN